jgi:hypothetical protein
VEGRGRGADRSSGNYIEARAPLARARCREKEKHEEDGRPEKGRCAASESSRVFHFRGARGGGWGRAIRAPMRATRSDHFRRFSIAGLRAPPRRPPPTERQAPFPNRPRNLADSDDAPRGGIGGPPRRRDHGEFSPISGCGLALLHVIQDGCRERESVTNCGKLDPLPHRPRQSPPVPT